MLQETFIQLAQTYSGNQELPGQCWKEIEKAYSHSKRHYHTLKHLDNLLVELQEVKSQISDWDTILFTLFYHDIVYKAHKQDNEEQSAIQAAERLTLLQVPEEKIKLCHSQILATKQHALSFNHDTNLFTDADLSILGKPWEQYEAYFQQVRKEYAIYPDFLYKPGRKKVLQHFLDMKQIFKTEMFRQKYEQHARENLVREIKTL